MTPLGGPVVVHQWFSVSTTVTTGVPSDQIGLTMTNEDFTLNIGGGLALSTDSDSGALSIAGKGVQYKTAEGTLQRPDELGLGGYYRSHITSTTSTGPVMRGLPGWDWGAGYETETVVVQDGITTGISTTARMHVTATPVVIATALVLNPGTAAALTFEEAAALTGYALAGT